jgi:hypothetical protein
MGWLDKAKVMLGILDDEDIADEGAPRAQKRIDPTRRDREGRPSLDHIEAPPQESLDDVLAARERGDTEEMRRLLERIDRGHGLRVVLRAAAALEAGNERELALLLPNVAKQQPAWKLPLQVAASLSGERAARMARMAEQAGAPPWAMAWARARSRDADERRHGLVDLLFADASLARTVAARELNIAGAEDDAAAGRRYVSFAHGRDCVARFGVEPVADLVERVFGDGTGKR